MKFKRNMHCLAWFIALCFALISQGTSAFSFAEALETLSNHEKEISRIGILSSTEGNEIRHAVIDISNQAKNHLANLDTQISTKRERLATLLKQPSNEIKEDSDKISIEDQTVVVDNLLMRNREALEISLLTLENEHKKASLVSVYADELLAQISEKSIEQNKQRLLYKSPSVLNAHNLQIAYQSLPSVIERISDGVARWVLSVIGVTGLLIFVLGPLMHRRFQHSYSDFMPTSNYPKWSFLIIFSLLILANCFYFVFVTQDQHLEFTFLMLLFLNIGLAVVMLKRLNDIQFVSHKVVIDGETVIKERQVPTFFISLVKLLIVGAVIASVAGYSVLGMYTLHNIVITMTAIILFLTLRAFWISNESHFLNKKNSDGIQKTNSSLFILTLVELGLAVTLFLVAARFWGVSLNNFEGQSSLLRGEFQAGSLTIEFSQVLASIMAFLAVFYFFKLIRWFLSERIFNALNVSIATSEAVLAIIGYMGFTFALIASLNALGVKWENLAIIAGALSVGIGFGLQTIISNFVSGLILLFERPVRVGDWVILGNGLEGHIKKVNMRSTEVLTLERSSVLIPNSNLLSDTITNWTLHDQMGRQDISVGVAYGSNTQLVKSVLLEVAAEHKLLRSYPIPQVLFVDFGDSSLDFILRIFLKNINDRHRVSSDLRFAIDIAFRENEITIPFPQRDLHITEPKNTSLHDADNET